MLVNSFAMRDPNGLAHDGMDSCATLKHAGLVHEVIDTNWQH